jgi:hypothetical protein
MVTAAKDVIGLGTEPLPRSGILVKPGSYTADQTVELSLQQSGVDDLVIVIDFTKVGAAPSVVFTVQGVVYPAGDFTGVGTGTAVTWTLIASAAVTSTGVTVLRVSDSMAAVTNQVGQDIVPDRIRVFCDHSNTDACTYSVTAVIAP